MGHFGLAGAARAELGAYPRLTDQAKGKILCENLAKLHGIDLEAKEG